MKKAASGMAAVVVGLGILTLAAVSAPAAQRPGFETYVVRSGDTLSKISGRVFGDVKRWREILKENPQVTNANLIFPGDTLLVPVPETAAPAGGTGGGLAAGAGAVSATPVAGSGLVGTETAAAPAAASDQGAGGALPGAAAAAGGGTETGTSVEAGTAAATAVPDLPVEQARSVAVVSPALYRTAGYIADSLPAIAIVASQDDRILLGSVDAAIVNAPIPAGRRFTVVRADRRIFHPVTGAYLGWLIRILGTAEVTCRAERTSTVALRAMNDAASVGDYLVPIDPNDVLEQNVLAGKAKPECIPAGAGDGVIVAFNEDRHSVGEQELAYIDRGTASGVAPGQRFTIYREIRPEGRITVGELQVLRAGLHTATALITTSVQEVQLGNLLRAR
jgi:LysM repeat protein